MNEIECAEACCLWTQYRASPFQTFSGECGTVELTCQFLVHSEEVADLASAHADVSGRNVHVRTDNLV